MPFLHSLLNVLRSWRRPAGWRQTRRRAHVAMEQLDHRRLMAVNFTGNAILDIPDTTGPGTAIVGDGQDVPIRNPVLNDLIQVSGFDIEAIRLKYTPDDDVLSVALQQPINPKAPEFRVIAGDADNNGNGGTVSPAVHAAQPLFMDFPNLGGSETMGIFLDLNNDTIPDVVAGIPNTPGAGKLYSVNDALVSSDPAEASTTAPGFGAPLPGNTGYSFLRDTEPEHGAFEFQITHFSELYKAKTGQDLKTDSVIGIGGFGGSEDDFIDEEFLAAQPVSFGVVPPPPPVCPPPPTDVCPPISPRVLINPHAYRHVNIAHPGLIRVNLFGTSGFDVNRIVPGSIQLGGATPIAHFTRHINRDEFLDATYVFRGDQINLPPGVVDAHLTGLYNDAATGKTVVIDTAKRIFVKDDPGAKPGVLAAQERRHAMRGADAPAFPAPYLAQRARQARVDLVIDQIQAASVQPWTAVGRPTVAIPTGGAGAVGYPVTVGNPMSVPIAPSPTGRPSRPAATVPVVVANPAAPSVSPAALRARERLAGSSYFDELAASMAR
jgi:hypothetical protein